MWVGSPGLAFFCTIPIPLLVSLLHFLPFTSQPSFSDLSCFPFLALEVPLELADRACHTAHREFCQCHRGRRRMSCVHGKVFLPVGAHLLFTTLVTAGSLGGSPGSRYEDASANWSPKASTVLLVCSVVVLVCWSGRLVLLGWRLGFPQRGAACKSGLSHLVG